MKDKTGATILIDTLKSFGCKTFFAVSGGAALHLMHAVRECPETRLIVVNHEQTVAMAVDAYSRITGEVAVGIVTSGPGATNLTTGIAGAYFDSIPCIFITGQVATFRQSIGLDVRQYGFQETRIPEIFKPITKSLIQIQNLRFSIKDLNSIIANSIQGRPGPVVIDFPDDLQRGIYADVVSQNNEQSFTSEMSNANTQQIEDKSLQIVELIKKSNRPIIVCGAGIANAGKKMRSALLEILDSISVPVCLTWGAKDLVPNDRKYLLGTFGTHGDRGANIAIQKSDFLLVLGSRLDTKSTGTPPETFAPSAIKIMCDIDESEKLKFQRFGVEIQDYVNIDFRTQEALEFIKNLSQLKNLKWDAWIEEASKKLYESRFKNLDSDLVEPYEFIQTLSTLVPERSRILVDTGCSIAWTMQQWRASANHRIFHDFNNTAMGWSIPAALASVLVDDDYSTICLIGDGSFMMALSDLITLKKFSKKTLVILMNNFGHSMIKQTQDQWFDGEYVGSDSKIDLSFPNFELLARSNGFNYVCYDGLSTPLTKEKIVEYLHSVTLLEVKIDPQARVIPQNRFGKPINEMDPEISKEGSNVN